jgi:hypothetical protein
MMAVKSSVKENKDGAFKVPPNQDISWKSGRGEVFQFSLVPLVTFSLFYYVHLKAWS